MFGHNHLFCFIVYYFILSMENVVLLDVFNYKIFVLYIFIMFIMLYHGFAYTTLRILNNIDTIRI